MRTLTDAPWMVLPDTPQREMLLHINIPIHAADPIEPNTLADKVCEILQRELGEAWGEIVCPLVDEL